MAPPPTNRLEGHIDERALGYFFLTMLSIVMILIGIVLGISGFLKYRTHNAAAEKYADNQSAVRRLVML